METNGTTENYEVLGLRVRLNKEKTGGIDPQKVINYLNSEAAKIKNKSPQLDNEQVAVLLALSVAADKMEQEETFQKDLDKLQTAAAGALHLIEEVSPSNSSDGEIIHS